MIYILTTNMYSTTLSTSFTSLLTLVKPNASYKLKINDRLWLFIQSTGIFILLASVPFLIPIDVSLSNLFTIASPLGTCALTILTLVSTAISPSPLPHLTITSLFTPLLTKINTHAFNSSPTISPFFVLPFS